MHFLLIFSGNRPMIIHGTRRHASALFKQERSDTYGTITIQLKRHRPHFPRHGNRLCAEQDACGGLAVHQDAELLQL